MISKKKIVIILILICLTSVFGTFNNTPINRWMSFLMLPISTYGHILFFVKKKESLS